MHWITQYFWEHGGFDTEDLDDLLVAPAFQDHVTVSSLGNSHQDLGRDVDVVAIDNVVELGGIDSCPLGKRVYRFPVWRNMPSNFISELHMHT